MLHDFPQRWQRQALSTTDNLASPNSTTRPSSTISTSSTASVC
jgi:hypothetical protein